jgi:hypothetical protein
LPAVKSSVSSIQNASVIEIQGPVVLRYRGFFELFCPVLLRKVRRGWKPLLQILGLFSWFQGDPKGREKLLRKVSVSLAPLSPPYKAFHGFRVSRRGMMSCLEKSTTFHGSRVTRRDMKSSYTKLRSRPGDNAVGAGFIPARSLPQGRGSVALYALPKHLSRSAWVKFFFSLSGIK